MSKERLIDIKKLDYMESLFTQDEPTFLQEIHSHFSDKRKLIQISPLEGKLISVLIKMNDIKRIVEVGTLSGYSALCMAQAIPVDGEVYTIEKNREHAQIARQHFAKHPDRKITLLEGDGIDELQKLASKGEKFDMIFIDADKSGYCNYLDWAEEHIRPKGLIVADNTLLFDTVYLNSPPSNVSQKSWAVMKEFNQRTANPDKYYSIMIPTAEGLTVAIKK